MFCQPVCMCSTFRPGVLGGQKRVFSALELGIQMGVSHHVGNGKWKQVLWKSSKTPYHWVISPALFIVTLKISMCIIDIITIIIIRERCLYGCAHGSHGKSLRKQLSLIFNTDAEDLTQTVGITQQVLYSPTPTPNRFASSSCILFW